MTGIGCEEGILLGELGGITVTGLWCCSVRLWTGGVPSVAVAAVGSVLVLLVGVVLGDILTVGIATDAVD